MRWPAWISRLWQPRRGYRSAAVAHVNCCVRGAAYVYVNARAYRQILALQWDDREEQWLAVVTLARSELPSVITSLAIGVQGCEIREIRRADLEAVRRCTGDEYLTISWPINLHPSE